MKRRGRFLLASAVGLLPLALTGVASADEPCAPLDIACLSGEIIDTTGDTVDETLHGVGDTVDETIGGVGDTVDPIVGPILDKVHEITDGVGDPTDPPGGGNGGGGGRGVDGGAPTRGSDNGHPRSPGDAGAPPTVHRHPADLLQAAGSPPSAVPRSVDVRPPADRVDVGGAVAAVARSFVVVGVLFGISLAFTLIQDRLDRKDPKLALAPVETELMTFA